MSFPHDGRNMDRPSGPGGSIKRAQERAAAGRPQDDYYEEPHDYLPAVREERSSPETEGPSSRRPAGGPNSGQSRLPRPQAPPGLQRKDGNVGLAISRPTPVPQWPLAGPPASSVPTNSGEPYQPPPGRSQPPQRPPRPSKVPSILDGSRIQDHTPVFQYTPQSGRDSADNLSGDQATSSGFPPSSRPSTLSSVGSIPDFPLPMPLPAQAPRKSINLGPPPSSRRGASSFYSNASYVSPIPEESPRSRSHASYASSAAMPESWGSASPGPSPNYPDAFFDDSVIEDGSESHYHDQEDEKQLVRSASLGKRGKPALVTTRAPSIGDGSFRPSPSPVQSSAFGGGTGFLEASSSSSGTLPTLSAMAPVGTAVTADSMLGAFDAASARDPSINSATPSPQPFSRLSAIRRPPKLDIDAVRSAEARGSLTSLPDLIRRATRLAASLERGKRPASRFDNLNDFADVNFGGRRDELEGENEKHQSGFSDMLAAFPPPAHANRRSGLGNSFRQQVGSWPLNFNRSQNSLPRSEDRYGNGEASGQSKDKRKRCCGMPRWLAIIVVIVILIIIAAAVVIPLEFFVIRKKDAPTQDPQPELADCEQQLKCANGGTNIVSQGVCSCLCTNGFTGKICNTAGTDGCTTASFSQSGSTNLENVTLGNAIPRLIQEAQSNFSLPLDATAILVKFNTANLSCGAENALVTFDGQSDRQGDVSAEVVDHTAGQSNAPSARDGAAVSVVTVMAGQDSTSTMRGGAAPTPNAPLQAAAVRDTTDDDPGLVATRTTTTTTTVTPLSTSRGTIVASTTATTTAPVSSATFTVTEEVLDFSRAAVLFVLQDVDLDDAQDAQTALQRFFTSASKGAKNVGTGESLDAARSVNLGNGNSVDLVKFVVTTSSGSKGGDAAAEEARLVRRWSRLLSYQR